MKRKFSLQQKNLLHLKNRSPWHKGCFGVAFQMFGKESLSLQRATWLPLRDHMVTGQMSMSSTLYLWLRSSLGISRSVVSSKRQLVLESNSDILCANGICKPENTGIPRSVAQLSEVPLLFIPWKVRSNSLVSYLLGSEGTQVTTSTLSRVLSNKTRPRGAQSPWWEKKPGSGTQRQSEAEAAAGTNPGKLIGTRKVSTLLRLHIRGL